MSTITPLPRLPSAVPRPPGTVVGAAVGADVGPAPGAAELPGRAELPGSVELAAAGDAAAAPCVSTTTIDGATAWYANCDRAGPGVTEASAEATLLATSWFVSGFWAGTIAPYSNTAMRAAAMPMPKGAAHRVRFRNFAIRDDLAPRSTGVALSWSCGSGMNQPEAVGVAARSGAIEPGGCSAVGSLRFHPEASMKTGESRKEGRRPGLTESAGLSPVMAIFDRSRCSHRNFGIRNCPSPWCRFGAYPPIPQLAGPRGGIQPCRLSGGGASGRSRRWAHTNLGQIP